MDDILDLIAEAQQDEEQVAPDESVNKRVSQLSSFSFLFHEETGSLHTACCKFTAS